MKRLSLYTKKLMLLIILLVVAGNTLGQEYDSVTGKEIIPKDAQQRALVAPDCMIPTMWKAVSVIGGNKEMNNLSDGLIILSKIFNKVKDIILVLEIPSFKSGFKMDAYKYFEIIITNYFNKFVNNNVELCFDTAHLFANCVDSQDMIKLFESKIPRSI